MLCVNKYPQSYINDCRKRTAEQVSAFEAVRAAVPGEQLGALETHYFNNLVLVLECSFVHRTRSIEKKDGNPLNEVRMLCSSLLNGGVFGPDSTIKYDPAKSVLKYGMGDTIRLTSSDFSRLSAAFFADLEKKYL